MRSFTSSQCVARTDTTERQGAREKDVGRRYRVNYGGELRKGGFDWSGEYQ